MVTGVLVGLALSLLSLVPGLHVATWLLGLLPLLGGDIALSAAGTFVGSSALLGILHATYHPVAEGLLAHADVAAKLAYAGQGGSVVRLHKIASIQSASFVMMLGLLLLGLSVLGADMLKTMTMLLKPLMPWILSAVVAMTILRAGRPGRTLLVCLAATTLGFLTFNGIVGESGGEWGMGALLGGLFMLPSAIGLLTAEQPLELPMEIPSPWPIEAEIVWAWRGMWAGMVTGFLAGVGTGSLVSLLRREGMGNWDYIRMASAADVANSLFALIAFAATGATRSGVAAALAGVGGGIDAVGGLMLCVSLSLGLAAGAWMLPRLAIPYRDLAGRIPQKLIGTVLLSVGGLTVLVTVGLPGMVVLLGGWMVSSLAKSWGTPNQALLVALIGPVLIGQFGLTRLVAGGLGLV